MKNNENLLEYLTQVSQRHDRAISLLLAQATVMVVSVTASTTQGKDLTKEELDTVATACDMAMELHESKTKIFECVTDKVCF